MLTESLILAKIRQRTSLGTCLVYEAILGSWGCATKYKKLRIMIKKSLTGKTARQKIEILHETVLNLRESTIEMVACFT